MRQALRECFSNWALSDIDFVGSLIMEIGTDRALENRVISTMKILGIEVVLDFDALESAIRKREAG